MPTREQVEIVLVRRAGTLLRQSGLDGLTQDGTNADLADPIAMSLVRLGISVLDITDPTDAEVLQVVDADLEEFLDRAELRTLNAILGNWAKPNAQLDTYQQDWGDLIALTNERVGKLQARIDDLYPAEMSEPSAGLMRYDFQTREDDDTIF